MRRLLIGLLVLFASVIPSAVRADTAYLPLARRSPEPIVVRAHVIWCGEGDVALDEFTVSVNDLEGHELGASVTDANGDAMFSIEPVGTVELRLAWSRSSWVRWIMVSGDGPLVAAFFVDGEYGWGPCSYTLTNWAKLPSR